MSQLFSEVNALDELPEAILDQLEHFFKNYNEQAGKAFRVITRLDAEQAFKLIENGSTD
ncbi:inorganic diphosphatase [Mucilaginibacter endophyticus]|uniref:inorganic diphosphatase n=1 Tax=Mucilaginibacter endophyticus TaxID=2675003 RepID=UPI00137B2CBE|nr:inorganic diphosphatase [Mucilaginibacter endophyticus]